MKKKKKKKQCWGSSHEADESGGSALKRVTSYRPGVCPAVQLVLVMYRISYLLVIEAVTSSSKP